MKQFIIGMPYSQDITPQRTAKSSAIASIETYAESKKSIKTLLFSDADTCLALG